MSEQTMQDNLYSTPVSILDKYTCLSLGATTINDLIKTKEIKANRMSKNLGKKPDVLIINKNKEVVVFIEFKKPEEFDTDKKKDKAIKQELGVAKELGAKIYVVSDGEIFLWLNPKTGNFVVDDKGSIITRQIKPKQEVKRLAEFIDLVSLSIGQKHRKCLSDQVSHRCSDRLCGQWWFSLFQEDLSRLFLYWRWRL